VKTAPALKKTAAVLAVLLPALALAAPTTWKPDAVHSSVGFAVKHLVFSTVKGGFGKYDATITLEDDVAKSSVEATIDAASIETREPNRDNHLRSPDFFDVAKYPTITFKSTKVEKAGADALKVTGDLTIHGVTKPVVLAATLTPEYKGPKGEGRRSFSATTKINRKDFGLLWNKALEVGPIVGDEVTIELELETVKEPIKS
jgi:polyisoprenoid-binding protein YceI